TARVAFGEEGDVSGIVDRKTQAIQGVEDVLGKITECILSPELAVTAACDSAKLTARTHENSFTLELKEFPAGLLPQGLAALSILNLKLKIPKRPTTD